MSDLSSDAQQKVLQLKEAYVASLSEKIEVLNNNWQAVIKETSDVTDLESLRVFSHKLAGSSGSYGLEEISTSARVLDELITELMKTTEQPKQIANQLKPSYENLVVLLQGLVDR